MPSGTKTMVINSRERAVSTDINRLQAFLASEMAQTFFELCGKYSASDDRLPGVETTPATGGAPPYNAVLNGLRFYPLNGTVDGLVTPGSVLVDNAAAGTDDAPFLFCSDPGVTAVGTLQLTPGPGATRIDVIECQPIPTVLETDNRDIYNIATGLFAPMGVTKVVAHRLTYRVRTGVAGAGWPGLAAGWIPIAVARVPAAAATWDDCDLWDVRNLVSEFWNGPSNTQLAVAEVEKAYLSAQETLAAAPHNTRLTGKLIGRYKHFRIGGSAIGNYPTDAAYVDISSGTSNWEAGLVMLALAPWYLYLAFPYDLPGWRKYCSSAASPRVPTAIRGIPIVTSVFKSPGVDRTPIAAIALPTALGFGGTTREAVCVFGAMTDAANGVRGALADGETIMFSEPQVVAPTVSDPLVSGITQYTVADTLNVPVCAKKLLVELVLALSKAGPPGSVLPVEIAPLVRVYDNTAATRICAQFYPPKQSTLILAASTTAVWTLALEIPLPFRAAPSGTVFDIVWNIQPAGAAFTGIVSDSMNIRGWRLD